MSGFTFSLFFRLANQGVVNQATAAVSKLDTAVDKATSSLSSMGTASSVAGGRMNNAFSGASSGLNVLLGRLGVGLSLLESIRVAAQQEGFRESMTFNSGDAKTAAENLGFLDKTVDTLGLNLKASQNGFRQLAGSMKGSGVTMKQTRDIFTAVSEAAVVNRLSAEDTGGAFTALAQMASKGKVQAEELRGQLGERLTGAFYEAAESMGMTTREFDKALETGKVFSADFLPKFAEQLHKTYGVAAVEASQSATANFNRLNNSFLRTYSIIGEQLLPTALHLIDNYLIPVIGWIGKNIEVLGIFASALGAVYVSAKAYSLYTGIASLVTTGFTGTVWGLNAALWANPITWVVGIVIALGAAAVYAWNKWENFRRFVVGALYAAFEGFISYVEAFYTPIITIAEVAVAAFTGKFDQIDDILKNRVSRVFGAGERIGAAYNKGWNKGSKADIDFTSEMLNDKSSVLKKGAFDKKGDAVSNQFSGKSSSGVGSLGNSVSRGASEITGGGKETKNITINLGKLMDQVVIQSTTVREGAGELREIILRELLQVLNTANQTQ